MRLHSILLATLLASTTHLTAEESQPLEALPDAAPPPPPAVQSGVALEPEVTISPEQVERDVKGGAKVEEHKVGGRLQYVKITPKIGKPYYLFDTDGNGVLESRMSQLYSNFVIPQWVIFSWE
ncbi:MAG TPA: DUF2782 domain-containing protein [Gammaproteobacteria bacterium]|nr:DUF2782 domain-containing protein [Gammaproteobacteria bacterium]